MPNLHNEHAETSALNKIERYNLQYNLKQQSKNNAAPTLIRYLQIEWQAFYSKFIFERPSTALVQSTERSLINCIYQRGIVNILLLLFPSPSFGLCSGPSQIIERVFNFKGTSNYSCIMDSARPICTAEEDIQRLGYSHFHLSWHYRITF